MFSKAVLWLASYSYEGPRSCRYPHMGATRQLRALPVKVDQAQGFV